MASTDTLSLTDHFADLPDPRIDRSKRHELLDIIVIALCAVISSAQTWVEIEIYGKAKLDWLRTFLKLPNGIPSHDTFARVFARLDPEAFGRSFLSWIDALSRSLGLKTIAIDGKTLRHSFDTAAGKAALHLVSAWASANHLTLGQVAVDEGSNEISAIPTLLELLDLSGAIVTIDAIGCQKDIAAQIRQAGADYVLAVKDNQERLCDDVVQCFARALESDFAGLDYSLFETVERGHGRQETRRYHVIADPAGIRDLALWEDLCGICMVVREREVAGRSTLEAHYYISSLRGSAEQYAQAIRGHWGIENGLHWILDVYLGEDQSRVRKGNAPENLAWLRRLAVSLLKNETATKAGTKAKQLKAACDNDYLLKVLCGSSGN